MNESEKDLELLRKKLEELYIRVRKGEACEEEAVKLSMVMDLLLVDITRELNEGNKPSS